MWKQILIAIVLPNLEVVLQDMISLRLEVLPLYTATRMKTVRIRLFFLMV